MSALPAAHELIFACTSCSHWQIDIHPRAVRDLGGTQQGIMAIGEAHAEHVTNDCPGGTTGRVKVSGRWVERMKMSDGKDATGMVQAWRLPSWWVWR